jgi:hypothetical protein
MVKILRRTLVMAVLMFWQGGFTFYGAVVVPIGADVLGSHREQGVITQRVTNYLNLAGAAVLPVLAWDMLASSDPARRRRQARWVLWGLLVATLAGLFWLHLRLDALLEGEQRQILEVETFRTRHQLYLLVSTAQWAAAMMGLALALWAWRAEDAESCVNRSR